MLEPIKLPVNIKVNETGDVIKDDTLIPDLDEQGNPIIPDDVDKDKHGEEPNKDPLVIDLNAEKGIFDITDFKFEDDSKTVIQDGDNEIEAYLTENGDYINKEGKILLTKDEVEQLAAQTDTEDEDSFTIDNISKLSGIELKDADGKPLVFENTPQGFAAREAKIREQAVAETKQEVINEFFKTNPDIAQVYNHKLTTGSINNFVPVQSLTETPLTKDDVELMEKIITAAQLHKGDSQERITRFIGYSKADNKLMEDALEAQTYLKTVEQNKIAETQRVANEQNTKYYGISFENGKEVVHDIEGSIYDKIVKKGQISGFRIPEVGIKIKREDGSIQTMSRKQVFDYISYAADTNGNTQAMIDYNKRLSNVDEKLLLYLTTLMHGDLSQLSNQVRDDNKGKRIPTITIGNNKPASSSNKPRIIKYNLPVKH